jgi:hypothetical protein
VGGSIPPDLTLPSTQTMTPILNIILNVGLCPGKKERRGEDMRRDRVEVKRMQENRREEKRQ